VRRRKLYVWRGRLFSAFILELEVKILDFFGFPSLQLVYILVELLVEMCYLLILDFGELLVIHLSHLLFFLPFVLHSHKQLSKFIQLLS